MTRLPRIQPLALCLIAAVGAWTPALAEPLGSAASSASSAGSASLGSLSDSVQGSSRSSGGKADVAEGQYRVLEVAAAPGKPDQRLLRLQATKPAAGTTGELMVQIPVQALGEQGMQAGEAVHIRHRVYGLEFARAAHDGAAAEPFFLALEEAWQRQMASREVTL